MTHDELLAKLVITEKDGENIYVPLRRYQIALRAVVELHKPDAYGGTTCTAHEQCWGCGEWGAQDDCDCEAYPCQTIKAIEKSLND